MKNTLKSYQSYSRADLNAQLHIVYTFPKGKPAYQKMQQKKLGHGWYLVVLS